MPSYDMSKDNITREANIDFTNKRFGIVELVAGGKVGLPSANQGFGVIQNEPRSGEAATIAIGGVSRVFAGGTIALGNYFTSTASGTAVAITSGSNARIVGRAIEAAASGSIFPAVLFQGYVQSSSGAFNG